MNKSDAPEFNHAKSLLAFVREMGWDLYVLANGAESILSATCKMDEAQTIPIDVIDSIKDPDTTQKIIYLLIEEKPRRLGPE